MDTSARLSWPVFVETVGILETPRGMVVNGQDISELPNNIRWAPSLDDIPYKYLFWVICDVWPDRPDRTSEVSIRTSDDFGCCHPRLAGLEHGSHTRVEELPTEASEGSCVVVLAFAWITLS